MGASLENLVQPNQVPWHSTVKNTENKRMLDVISSCCMSQAVLAGRTNVSVLLLRPNFPQEGGLLEI